jgi:hypothetical protein
MENKTIMASIGGHPLPLTIEQAKKVKDLQTWIKEKREREAQLKSKTK